MKKKAKKKQQGKSRRQQNKNKSLCLFHFLPIFFRRPQIYKNLIYGGKTKAIHCTVNVELCVYTI
jgi:hypothetical protein